MDYIKGGMVGKMSRDTIRVYKRNCSSFPNGTATQVTKMQPNKIVNSIPLRQEKSILHKE